MMLRRVAPALGLFLLAPLLVREGARHARRGWPARTGRWCSSQATRSGASALPSPSSRRWFPIGRRPPGWGRAGLTVAGVLFPLRLRCHLPRPPGALPRTGATAVAAALVGIAFVIGRKQARQDDRRAPRPQWVGAAALVASSLFFARPENWLGVALGILLLAGAAMVTHWSRRAGWTTAHRLALAGGAGDAGRRRRRLRGGTPGRPARVDGQPDAAEPALSSPSRPRTASGREVTSLKVIDRLMARTASRAARTLVSDTSRSQWERPEGQVCLAM